MAKSRGNWKGELRRHNYKFRMWIKFRYWAWISRWFLGESVFRACPRFFIQL